MTYDVAALRAEFPSLESGIAHFDGPGGTQTPRVVGEVIARVLTGPLSNRGTEGPVSETNAEDAIAGFRTAAADLLGADPRGIVYGRSATQLAYDFSRHLAKDWGPGDEVVVTRLDHDSNVRPWVQAAEHAGATVRWIEFDPSTADLDPESVAAAITPATRLVAVTAASNLLGTRPAVRAIADAVHAVGGLAYVDGVHATAHGLIDVAELGADFFVCSPYKFLGPHCALLAAAPALLESIHPDKLAPSTNEVPERFEFGTLPYETMAGVTAAIDFLAGVAPGGATGRRARLAASVHAMDEHELALRQALEAGLAELDVVLYSRAADRTPTLSISLPGRRTMDAYRFLAARDVLAPASDFYAYEAFKALNVDDEGLLRLGVAPYTTDDEVQRALDGLRDFLRS